MKYFLTLIIACLISAATFAQVSEGKQSMSLGLNPAFSVTVDGANKKTTEKLWKDYLKEYGKVEKNKKAKEFYMTQVRIPSITGTGLVNLFSKIDDTKTSSTIHVWVDNGSSFVSSDESGDSAEGAKHFLREFSYVLQKEVITKELEDEEDRLKDLNKDLSKLEKKNKNLHGDIEKANEKIRKAEQDIEKNLKDQDDKRAEIEAQQEKVQEVTEKLNNVGKEG